MKTRATFLSGIGLLLVSLPAFAGPPAGAGVTRTHIEGVDNWGWQGGPISSPTIICPGGDLIGPPFDCSDSMTGRLHLRDGAGWGCLTSNDARLTGIAMYTSNGNFDAGGNGPAWGEWKMVPMVDCNKDAVYSEEYADLVEDATSFWYGTWHGQRQFDSDVNAWLSDLSVVARGFGEDLSGQHFKATESITTITPFPMPYEYIFPPGSEEFDWPEASFVGTIKD